MSIESVLNTFGKKVIKDSRANLTRKDKRVSNSLYKSLDFEINNKSGVYSVTFLMDDYGKFIDKGVKGSKNKTKAPNSPYKYTNKMPPIKALDKWVVKRGLAGRNKKGQFVSRDSIKFAIAKSIFLNGIETTNFFTTPLERESLRLIDNLAAEVLENIEL